MNQEELDAEVERLRALFHNPDEPVPARDYTSLSRVNDMLVKQLFRTRAEVERQRALVPDPDWLEQLANYIHNARAFYAGLHADLELEVGGLQKAWDDAGNLNKLAQRIREANGG